MCSGKGKVWTCIARTSYKSLPIKSLGFSSDTSLLGVGFGNTLCIYNPETLQLRCALSAPSGLDGSISKMSIMLPTNYDKSDLEQRRRKFIEKRKKMSEAIKSMLELDDVVTVAKKINSTASKATKSRRKLPEALTDTQKKMVFNQVLASNSISLFQKIHIFDKFNVCGRVPLQSYKSYTEYCEQVDSKLENANILGRMLNLSSKHKFKFAYKYHHSNVQSQRNRQTLAALRRVVNRVKVDKSKKMTNGVSGDDDNELLNALPTEKQKHQQPTVQITHVAFCNGEFAHLVIVCTEKRLLIWNLLTLRLQSAFKISVDKVAIDMHTSLVAIVSKNHDLYVFLPNTPITLYQHKQLPKIDGMAWIPRKYPKSHSLTIDWQAHTELYFLSSDKQVRRLIHIEKFPFRFGHID